MEKLISKQLLAKVKTESAGASVRYLSEAKLKLERRKLQHEISVFLSHKHGETEIIEQAITLLNCLGVAVYVDWQDYGIPKTTDGSTAIRIKNKIRENEKF